MKPRPGSQRAAVTPAPKPPGGSWRRHLLPLAGLAACTLAAYSNSFQGGFLFDSEWVVQQDSRIRSVTAENLKLIFTEDYSYRNSSSGLYRPLTTLSYLFNYAVLGNGSGPAGYHWTNFVLHAFNISLVYLLGLLLFQGLAMGNRLALAVAALWGLHPVMTESVTNIVGRADLLAAFGVLAGLLCHVQCEAARGRGRLKWVAALAVAAAIGIFSKESAVALLAVMLLYDIVVAFVGTRIADRLRNLWPNYAAVAASFLIFFYFRAQALARGARIPLPFTDNPLAGADFMAARLTAFKVIGEYVWLLFWPRTLSPDYSFNQIPVFAGRFATLEDWKAIAALVFCAVALGTAALGWRKHRLAAFWIAFFFATLSPTANLLVLIGTIMGERFLYLPSLAFAACLVLALRKVLPDIAMPAALGCIVLALATRTYLRNADWRDDLSLWTASVEASPSSYKTHLHLATAMLGPNGENMDQAIAEIDRSLAILDPLPDDRNVPQAYATAGYYYLSRGGQSARTSSADGSQWYRRAVDTLLRGERIDRTAARRILADNRQTGRTLATPGWYPLYLALGEAYLRLSDPSKAIAVLEYGTTITPIPEFFEELSAAHRAAGDPRRAAIALIEGMLIDRTATRLAPELIGLYQQIDPGGCAILRTGNTTAPNLACPLVHDHFCAAAGNVRQRYLAMGQPELAEATRARAAQEFRCSTEALH